jgi:hypothetical protein
MCTHVLYLSRQDKACLLLLFLFLFLFHIDCLNQQASLTLQTSKQDDRPSVTSSGYFALLYCTTFIVTVKPACVIRIDSLDTSYDWRSGGTFS